MDGVRLVLRDDRWARMEPHLRGKATDRGVTGDNRRFVEAVLWIVRTSSPWRDLPPVFGNWNSVFRRFALVARRGLAEAVRCAGRGSGLRLPDRRFHHRPGAPARHG